MKKMVFVAALLTITQQAQASAVIVASAAATTAAVAAANSANIASQQERDAANASASALPISVKGSKQHLGFITCGTRTGLLMCCGLTVTHIMTLRRFLKYWLFTMVTDACISASALVRATGQ